MSSSFATELGWSYFDHLVGAGESGRFRGVEINDQLELRRCSTGRSA